MDETKPLTKEEEQAVRASFARGRHEYTHGEVGVLLATLDAERAKSAEIKAHLDEATEWTATRTVQELEKFGLVLGSKYDAERARAARTEALYAGAYALLCEFDVYGAGGDVSACAREVKQRLMEATQALDAERAKVVRLREGLEHAAKSLESASAHYKVDDDNVRAYCLSRATVARTVLRETGGEP